MIFLGLLAFSVFLSRMMGVWRQRDGVNARGQLSLPFQDARLMSFWMILLFAGAVFLLVDLGSGAPSISVLALSLLAFQASSWLSSRQRTLGSPPEGPPGRAISNPPRRPSPRPLFAERTILREVVSQEYRRVRKAGANTPKDQARQAGGAFIAALVSEPSQPCLRRWKRSSRP